MLKICKKKEPAMAHFFCPPLCVKWAILHSLIMTMLFIMAGCFDHEKPFVTEKNTAINTNFVGYWSTRDDIGLTGSYQLKNLQIGIDKNREYVIQYDSWDEQTSRKSACFCVTAFPYTIAGQTILVAQLTRIIGEKGKPLRDLGNVGNWDYFLFSFSDEGNSLNLLELTVNNQPDENDIRQAIADEDKRYYFGKWRKTSLSELEDEEAFVEAFGNTITQKEGGNKQSKAFEHTQGDLIWYSPFALFVSEIVLMATSLRIGMWIKKNKYLRVAVRLLLLCLLAYLISYIQDTKFREIIPVLFVAVITIEILTMPVYSAFRRRLWVRTGLLFSTTLLLTNSLVIIILEIGTLILGFEDCKSCFLPCRHTFFFEDKNWPIMLFEAFSTPIIMAPFVSSQLIIPNTVSLLSALYKKIILRSDR